MPSSNDRQKTIEQLELILSHSADNSELSRLEAPKITTTVTWNKLQLRQTAIKAMSSTSSAIAINPWWQFCLVAVGTINGIVYPHPPLVGLAAVVGNTLIRQKALMSIETIWYLYKKED